MALPWTQHEIFVTDCFIRRDEGRRCLPADFMGVKVMATLAVSDSVITTPNSDERFFVRSAIVVALTIVAGFSLQYEAGRSTFMAPPLVHAHAIIFMGWVAIYLAQNLLVGSGRMEVHKRLGWIAAGWIVPMIVLGCAVTITMVRAGHAPFFFRPLHFLVFDPLSLFGFAGLTVAAIVMRRETLWHRRLHFCGMSMLLGPAFGRLLPLPLLQPWAWEATFASSLLFPLAGVIADRRRTGRVHRAWAYGIGAMIGCFLVIEAITYSPIGTALYRVITAGSAGASVAPLEFAAPPAGGGPVTGRG